MSHLKEFKFYDDYDKLYTVCKIVKKKRYKKAFKFLLNHFFIDKRPWITSSILQEQLGIPNHSSAFQILESFRVIGLFKKKVSSIRRKALFTIINPDLWKEAKKEVEPHGSKRANK